MTIRGVLRSMYLIMAILIASHRGEKPAFVAILGCLTQISQASAQTVGASEAERSQLVQARNAAWKAAATSKAAGEFGAALKHLGQVVDLQRRLGFEASDQFVSILGELALVQEYAQDFAAAKATRLDVLTLVKQLHGADSWQATDAQLALNFTAQIAALPPPMCAKLFAADPLVDRIQALDAQGKYAAALLLAEQLVAIRSEILGKDSFVTVDAQSWLAHELCNTRDAARARSIYHEGLEFRKRVLGPKHPQTATSYHDLAFALQLLGDFAAAKPLYQQALTIRQEVLGGQHPSTAVTLIGLGKVYEQMGESAAAQSHYEQALTINKKALGERHPDTATALDRLAVLLGSMGNYAAAKPILEQAMAIRKEVLGEQHPDTAISLTNLAGLLESMGDYALARPLHEQALAIQRKVLGNKHPGTATALNSLAWHHDATGDGARAKPLYEEALAINREVLGEKHPSTATTLNNLAKVHADLGDYAAAKFLYEQALAIRREVLGERHSQTAVSLNNLAALLRSIGDYAGAKPLYEQSLRIRREVLGVRHPSTGLALINLGALMLYMDDPASAEPLLIEAAEIALASLDQTATAQSERQQFEMNRSVRKYIDVCLTLADRHSAAAPRVYELVLAWKGAIFVRQHWMHLAAERPELAASFGEWQTVSNRLATQMFATPTPDRAAHWRSDIAGLTEQKERLEAEMARQSAEFRQLQTRPTPTLLRKSLPVGAALVDIFEYSHWTPAAKGEIGQGATARKFAAFVVRADRDVKLVALGPESTIAEALDAWRKAMESGQADPIAAAGDRLRKLLWHPLAAELAGVELLLVSPDGALAQFPWAALPGAKAGSFLVEDLSVAVVPVPQLLPTMTVSDDGSDEGALLLVGEVDYGAAPGDQQAQSRSALGIDRNGARQAFADISTNTRAEITAIRDSFEQRFPDARVQQLRKQRATESAFRTAAGKSRWLHLATHGYFAPESLTKSLLETSRGGGEPALGNQSGLQINPGLLSGLALTGANNLAVPGQDDGIMTAVEVAALDLRGVEMAVLSACETGLGKVAAGEGLLGLPRAFQVGGAKTTVASLWKVPDRATTQLMTRFYENLWDKKMTKLAALREAQLWMLREGAGRGIDLDEEAQASAKPAQQRLSPRFWAAFVLSGDWR